MTVDIKVGKAYGTVFAPPSKSMAHRALICGALSRESIIKNIAFSKDIEATLNCLNALGAKVEICDTTVKIGGFDIENVSENTVIDCYESGSTLRFLLPLCMSLGKTVTLTGSKRLFERPLCIYEQIAHNQGILFERNQNCVKVCGKLQSGDYKVAGDISSQFISGLLFLLPLMSGNSTVTVTGRFESASYVDLTLDALKDFGINVRRNNNIFYISGGQIYNNCNYTVEGDCSNAAFLEAFNYLGGKVQVKGIKENTLQGDRVYKEIFDGLKNGVKNFNLSDCPDLAPVCFALASVYGGARFDGTRRLRIKESDRAQVMKTELKKFNIDLEIGEDYVIVNNGKLSKPDLVLNSHNDHRIVMALSLLLTITGGSIAETQAVAKSYPNFFDKIRSIGIDVNEIN